MLLSNLQNVLCSALSLLFLKKNIFLDSHLLLQKTLLLFRQGGVKSRGLYFFKSEGPACG